MAAKAPWTYERRAEKSVAAEKRAAEASADIAPIPPTPLISNTSGVCVIGSPNAFS